MLPAVKPPEYDPSYGFCLFRIPAKGGRVIWEITNTCNYGCRYCIFSSTSRQQKDELDTAQALQVVDDLKAAGFTHIKVTGGEPFMRPDIMDVLRHARAQNMTVDISTNAAYITPEMAQELGTMGLEMVHVSLDGPDEVLQETVRGKRTFAPTLEGLKALTAAKVHVRIGCVLYRDNQNALHRMAEFCYSIGAAEVIFSLMEPVGRMKKGDQLALLCDRPVADIQAEIAVLAKAFAGKISVKGNFAETTKSRKCGTCPGGDKFLFIDHKGRVSPCTWVSERAPQNIPAATLHTHRLPDILRGNAIAGFRRKVSALSAAGLDRCPMQDMPAFDAHDKIAGLFEGDVEKTIDNQPKFSTTAKMYKTATENIADAFAHFDLKSKRVITVCGSGDQALSAAAAGAQHVTAFDVNLLSLNLLMLKHAAVKNLSTAAFRVFMTDFNYATYTKLKTVLPLQAQLFWNKAYAAFGNNGLALAQSKLFHAPAVTTGKNTPPPHADAAIDYICADVAALPAQLKGKSFDFLWLSNIADYAHKMFTGDYLAQFRTTALIPLLPHVAPGGVFVIAYVYDAIDRNHSSQRSDINRPASRRAAFAPPPGFTYREIEIPGAIEADNPDTLIVWEKLHAT